MLFEKKEPSVLIQNKLLYHQILFCICKKEEEKNVKTQKKLLVLKISKINFYCVGLKQRAWKSTNPIMYMWKITKNHLFPELLGTWYIGKVFTDSSSISKKTILDYFGISPLRKIYRNIIITRNSSKIRKIWKESENNIFSVFFKEKSTLFCHGNFTIPWAGQVNFITIWMLQNHWLVRW